jgi:hypothetical protein
MLPGARARDDYGSNPGRPRFSFFTIASWQNAGGDNCSSVDGQTLAAFSGSENQPEYSALSQGRSSTSFRSQEFRRDTLPPARESQAPGVLDSFR